MTRSPSPRFHRGYRRAGCFLVCAALLFASGGIWLIRKGPTPEQIERQFRSALPIGTTRAAAESWLKDHGIKYDAEDNNAGVPGAWRLAAPEKAGGAARQVSSTVVARVEPAFVDLFWHGAVSVYLYFDTDGKLINYGFVPTEPGP
jgi:hypothetical protein